MRKKVAPLRDFLHRESSSGVILLTAATLGLATANSPASSAYFDFLALDFEFTAGIVVLKLTTLKVINYILMTIFFFVVGLEIKRELTSGHLSRFRDAIMPFIAAVGGMALPALIYLAIAGSEAPRGWAIPVATDIALAVGTLALLGNLVIPSLRTFLLGLAVIDDIGAILIIAFIYSSGVAISWFFAAAVTVIVIALVKKFGVRNTYIYVLLGLALWYTFYRTGIHPTLAGVVLGLLTPNAPKEVDSHLDVEDGTLSVIEWLEAKLHPWSTYVVVPIFAFANTGVILTSEALKNASTSVIAWGIFAGLVIGKPVGILLAMVSAKKLNIGDYPSGARNSDVLATGSAAGIGFTVAIFISSLAFTDAAQRDIAIIAVITASIVSGLLSWILFRAFSRR
ncbi:MAG: Na+/H+ antiporter NhaA [Candidatus Planktophila sp.]|jgi:NhaA family Na+:H+ antiporter